MDRDKAKRPADRHGSKAPCGVERRAVYRFGWCVAIEKVRSEIPKGPATCVSYTTDGIILATKFEFKRIVTVCSSREQNHDKLDRTQTGAQLPACAE